MKLFEQFWSKIVECLHKVCISSQTNDKIEPRINKRPWTPRTFPAPETPRKEQNCKHVFIFRKDDHSCSDVNWLSMFPIFCGNLSFLLWYNYQQRIVRCIDKFVFQPLSVRFACLLEWLRATKLNKSSTLNELMHGASDLIYLTTHEFLLKLRTYLKTKSDIDHSVIN